MVGRRTRSKSRATGRGGHGLEVDDDTLAEALDLATHYLPTAAAPGNILRVLELVRDASSREARPRRSTRRR